MKRVVVLVMALGVVACAAGTPAPRHAELVIPPIGNVSGQGTPAPNARKTTGRCTVVLSTQGVQMSQPTCYLDQNVEDGGLLHYPCGGQDGEVTAVFDKLEYVGQLHDGEIELEKRTELDWPGDRCRWGTIGTIRGQLIANGEITKQKLQWVYADRVVSGTNCSGSCRASAILDVNDQE